MAADQIINQATGYNVPSPGNNTNIFTTSITPVYPASALRVTVCLATTSVFNVRVTDGTTAFTMSLNSGATLTAGNLYTFAFGVHQKSNASPPLTLTYNFQVATTGVINFIMVEEVPTGVI